MIQGIFYRILTNGYSGKNISGYFSGMFFANIINRQGSSVRQDDRSSSRKLLRAAGKLNQVKGGYYAPY